MHETKVLAQEILDRTGQNVYLCYQCAKCSAGCPLAEYVDLTPSQMMRALQLGQDGMVLNSTTISLCASCQTCNTRCPQGLDVAHLMDTLHIIARERGVQATCTGRSRFPGYLFCATFVCLGAPTKRR